MSPIDRFSMICKINGFINTMARQQIVDEIFKLDSAFTAVTLMEILSARGVSTNKATVYRTLQALGAGGMVKNDNETYTLNWK